MVDESQSIEIQVGEHDKVFIDKQYWESSVMRQVEDAENSLFIVYSLGIPSHLSVLEEQKILEDTFQDRKSKGYDFIRGIEHALKNQGYSVGKFCKYDYMCEELILPVKNKKRSGRPVETEELQQIVEKTLEAVAKGLEPVPTNAAREEQRRRALEDPSQGI